MIQVKSDGMTLFYTNSDGSEVSASPLDWQRYTVLSATQSAQIQAQQENTQAQSKYLGDLHDFQVAVDAGRASGLTAPAKPKMKVVSDTNAISWADFPSLPDPTFPHVTASSGGLGNRVAPLDPQTQAIMSALLALHAQVDRVIAKLGA